MASINRGEADFGKNDRRRKRKVDKTKETIHRHGTQSEIIVGQIYNTQSGEGPEDTLSRAYVYVGSAANLYNEELSGFETKAFASWDSLIRPVSIAGSGGLPRFVESYLESGELYASTIAAQPPISADQGSGELEYYHFQVTSDELDPTRSGHDIDVLGHGLSLSTAEGGHISATVEELQGIDHYQNDYRFFALRGPLIMTGPGFDTNGKPIPNLADNEEDANSGIFVNACLTNEFLEDYMKKSHTWPVAPVDLRYDRKRKVWVSPPPYKIVTARMKGDLSRFGEAEAYQTAGMPIFDDEGNVIRFDENITLTVRDVVGNEIASGEPVLLYYDTEGCYYIPLESARPVEEDDSGTTTEEPRDPEVEIESECTGFCVWSWVESGNGGTWELEESDCSYEGPPPSTTPETPWTSTTTTSTTTTTVGPGNQEYPECNPTTTGTTTTTTTAEPSCQCRPPDRCGTSNGEIIRTECIQSDVELEEPVYENCVDDCASTTIPPDCSTTTTTTTTEEPAGCSHCTWKSFGYADCDGAGELIYLIYNDCDPSENCHCPEPEDGQVPFCGEVDLGCVITPTTTYEPYCTGSCCWKPINGRWYWMHGVCYESEDWEGLCQCLPPNQDPDDVDECEVYYTSCYTPTTTQDPCEPDACTLQCRFNSPTGSSWIKECDPCDPECPCLYPQTSPWGAGEIYYTDCGSDTTTTTTIAPTTTTTTTTTTAGPTGACCNCPAAEDCTDGITEQACEACGGNFNVGQTCEVCFPPWGACCDGVNCSITWEEDCLGTWTEGEECDDAPGICCVGTECSHTPRNCCTGDFYESAEYECGVNVECPGGPTTTTTTTTEEPTGACCYGVEGGFCTEDVTESECAALSGQWHEGSTCLASCPDDCDCGTCTYAANGARISTDCDLEACIIAGCPSHIGAGEEGRILCCAGG